MLWRVCISDTVAPPYLTGDPQNQGVVERLLVDAGHMARLDVMLLRWPVQRCIEQTRLGNVDATLAGPNPANFQDFDFPGGAQNLDRSRRVARVPVVWIKREGTAYDWDGQRVTPANGAPRVGTRFGFRLGINALQSLGIRFDQSGLRGDDVLKMLNAGRFDLAVLLKEEAEQTLNRHPELSVVVLPKPLLVSDFYAVTGKNLPADRRVRTEAWWEAISQLRDLPAYKP